MHPAINARSYEKPEDLWRKTMGTKESASNILLIIPCGKEKSIQKGEKKKARDVYSSPFFKETLSYADKFHPDHFRILSTKYGLINGDTEIEWYEKENFSDEVRALIATQIDQQDLRKYRQIIALVSSPSYLKIVTDIFSLKQQNICSPLNRFFHLNGQKWNPMRKDIRERIDTGKPFECQS